VSDDTRTPDEWTERIEQTRAEKEAYFQDSPRSPLPPAQRGESFPGLAFYEPDPDYRFLVPLAEHETKAEVTVETTADGEQSYLRWGEFTFERDGETFSLQAYRPSRGADRLWVPFRDGTSGTETYGAGRYLDLEDDSHRVDGEWVVDFNMAYNPTCAYNHAYECPLIPPANWLEVRIEAGEKAFPGEPADPHEH